MKRRNFLAELIHEEQEKPRRQCKAAGMIYYCKKGLREYTAQKAMIAEISTTTCKVFCPVPEAVTGHVYLVMEQLRVKVPSAVSRRGDEHIELKFYEEIPTELFERIVTLRA
jgi:hypothetical protein